MKNECPICRLNNGCGKDQPQCWCMKIAISPQVRAKIDALNVPKSCICSDCLQQLSKENLSTKNESYSQTVDK